MNDTFCTLPWNQIATNSRGHYRLCCNVAPVVGIIKNDNGVPYNIYEHTIEEVWNSDNYKKIRKQMLNGQRPEACARCFKEEDSGIKSSRMGWNWRWRDNNKTYLEEAELDIKYLDIRLGNLCNLKCRMCNPYASNQWIDEWILVHPEVTQNSIIHLKNLNWMEKELPWENLQKIVHTLEEIYFTGGEPTIIKEQHKLLDYCIELGISQNIIIKYNTNLTNIPKHLLDKWKKFKLIKLNCSIDAIGNLNRYIRYPSNWSMIEKNFSIVKAMTNVRIQVHCTVQMYNILSIHTIIEWCDKQDVKLYLNILNSPDFLNIRVLPQNLKDRVEAQLMKYANIVIHNNTDTEETYEKVDSMLNYMFQENLYPKLFQRFIEYSEQLDISRGECLYDHIPEFKL